jgi:hypothetical protein
MRFTLHYRGKLKANGSPSHKHEIRRAFHVQLMRLWRQPPLSDHKDYLESARGDGNYSLQRPLGNFVFAPLICAEMNVVAELQVTLLRPEAPGNLLTQGGDIDNRMKTLFDALTMPRHENALAAGAQPLAEEKPYFFCLLEDDNLVTALSIETHQLLEPVENQSEVDVQVAVSTGVTRATIGNANFS